jgi:hypothetical protein
MRSWAAAVTGRSMCSDCLANRRRGITRDRSPKERLQRGNEVEAVVWPLDA